MPDLNPLPPENHGPAEVFLTTEEAAAFLSLRPKTLENWRTRNFGPPYYTPSPTVVRYLRSDLRAWMAAHREEGGQ